LSFAFRNKPLAAVGYSGGIGGGLRAIEHLVQIAVEAELVPLRTSVIIPQVVEAFDVNGKPINPIADISLRAALEDLAWWAATLKRARAAGQLQPAAFRIRAAAAAVNEVEDETG
jgi:NAD(P)H-dependent FMN reductase